MPQEIIVGYDALAIYVNKHNPLNSISIDELAEIFGEDGKLTKWSELGVPAGAIKNNKIVRVNRQNSSGTFFYFREAVLGKGQDMKLGSVDGNGSKDAVSLIAHTPSAIGYSGMGYATDGVKMLKVSRHRGGAGRGAHRRKTPATASIPSPAPCKFTWSASRPVQSRSISTGFLVGPEGSAQLVVPWNKMGYVPRLCIEMRTKALLTVQQRRTRHCWTSQRHPAMNQ